jgi:hypothetical protein
MKARKVCCSALQSALDVDMCIVDGNEIAWYLDKPAQGVNADIAHVTKCPFCGFEPLDTVHVQVPAATGEPER